MKLPASVWESQWKNYKHVSIFLFVFISLPLFVCLTISLHLTLLVYEWGFCVRRVLNTCFENRDQSCGKAQQKPSRAVDHRQSQIFGYGAVGRCTEEIFTPPPPPTPQMRISAAVRMHLRVLGEWVPAGDRVRYTHQRGWLQYPSVRPCGSTLLLQGNIPECLTWYCSCIYYCAENI